MRTSLGMRVLPHTLIIVICSLVWCAFVVAAENGAGAGCVGSSGSVSIYITDFGINQWKPNLKLGDDFKNTSARVFSQMSSAAQILVPMPSDMELTRMSAAQRTGLITDVVKRRIDDGLKKGITTFEVQIVQNVASPGYADPVRQARANQFGKEVYSALGDVVAHLKNEGRTPFAYAILGSNATKVFTENVPAWSGYVRGASFYDGRAFYTPTVDAIRALGAENVKMYNTRGDWVAPHSPLGRSIGNFDTTKDLKRQFPAMGAYLLDPVDRPNLPTFSHLAGMNEKSRFSVRAFDGHTLAPPTAMTGRDVLPRADLNQPTVARPVGGICLGGEQKYRTSPDIDKEIDGMGKAATP